MWGCFCSEEGREEGWRSNLEKVSHPSMELQRKDCSQCRRAEVASPSTSAGLSHWLWAAWGEYGLGLNTVANPKYAAAEGCYLHSWWKVLAGTSEQLLYSCYKGYSLSPSFATRTEEQGLPCLPAFWLVLLERPKQPELCLFFIQPWKGQHGITVQVGSVTWGRNTSLQTGIKWRNRDRRQWAREMKMEIYTIYIHNIYIYGI